MKTFLKPALAGLVSCALMSGAAWAESHADMSWTESKYGPDDEIGAANLLTPERAKMAARLVTEGKTYSLGLTLDSSVPAFAPRSMSIAILQPGQVNNSGLGPTETTYNDDIFMGWLGIGSQIDGLGHIGVDHIYYNGNNGSDFVMGDGMTKLGIEKVPPMVTRGVLLDMAKFYGKEMLDEGTAYTREDIMAAADQQGDHRGHPHRRLPEQPEDPAQHHRQIADRPPPHRFAAGPGRAFAALGRCLARRGAGFSGVPLLRHQPRFPTTGITHVTNLLGIIALHPN